MRRRQILTACGTALTALAGCGSQQPSTPSSTREPSTTPEQTATATSAGTLEAQLDALQPAVLEVFVDAYEFTAAGSQYLFLTGPGATEGSPRFRFDGTEYDPGVNTSYDIVRAPSEFGRSTGASNWVVFGLPASGDASDAALVGEGGTWRPDDTLRARLAAPLPSLTVETFEVSAGVLFTATVSNEGDHDGRFVGVLRQRDALDTGLVVSRRIPAGATETLTGTGEPPGTPTPGSGADGAITYELEWPGGEVTDGLVV